MTGPQLDEACGVVERAVKAVPSTVSEEDVAAHLSGHFAFGHAGQDPLHERVAGTSHDGASAGLEDGLFHVHGTLHVVDDAQVLVVGRILGDLVFVAQQVLSEQGDEPVGVDEPAFFVNRTDAVAVAVRPHAEFAPVLGDGFPEVDHVLGSGGVGAVVGFGGVPVAIQVHVLDAHLVEQFAHERSGHGVAAVHGDLDGAGERSGGSDDGVEVGVHVRVVNDLAGAFTEVAVEEDILQFLNFFTGQRQRAAAHLETVVRGHGQVTGGDHHATVHGQRPAGVVDAPGGDDTQIQHLDTTVGQTGHELRGERRRRVADITPNGEGIAFEVGGQGATQPVGEVGGQFSRAVTVGESTNVVGLETGFGPRFHGGWERWRVLKAGLRLVCNNRRHQNY